MKVKQGVIRGVGMLMILAFWLIPVSMKAQEPTPDPAQRENLWSRMESLKLWKVTEALEVDEQLAQKLFPRLRELDRYREQMGREMSESITELNRLLDMKPVDPDKLSEQIRKVETMRKAHFENQEKLRARVFEVLSDVQQARLIVLEDECPRRIREFMRHRGEGHRRDRFDDDLPPPDRGM